MESRYYAGQYPENQASEPQSPPQRQAHEAHNESDLRDHPSRTLRQVYAQRKFGTGYDVDSDPEEDDDQTDASYEHAQELRLSSNGFHGRPELTLVSSPEKRASASAARSPQDLNASHIPAEHRDHLAVEPNMLPRRTASVSEKSPLQNLEAKLGDISKEEKRARVEEAEQRARQRASLGHTSTATASRGSPQVVHRKPVPQGAILAERGDDSQRREAPASIAQSEAREINPAAPPHVSRLEPSHSSFTTARPNPQGRPDSFASIRTRGGGYGHDASLTGGAAALAVNAYQNVRRQHSVTRQSRTEVSEPYSNDSSPNYVQSNRQPHETFAEQEEVGRDSATRDMKQAPQHEIDNSSQGGVEEKGKRSLSAKIRSKLAPKTDHLVTPQSVAKSGSKGPFYEQPPQAASGPRAREAVGFGAQDPNEEAVSRHRNSGHRRIHFSDIVQRQDHPERRYQAPKNLDEWRTAPTAVLLADDMDLNPSDDGGQSRGDTAHSTGRRLGSNQSYGNRANSGSYNEPVQTTFRPALMLKCGPLLRYAGISRAAEGSREFWRGTVMIVTEDLTSMYRPSPTLKLFKQDMDLLPPPPLRIDGETGQELAPEYVDPLAGQPTTSRMGQTLYVRPVHHLPAETDLSRIETDDGLFEPISTAEDAVKTKSRIHEIDGPKTGRFQEIKAFRLHAERGVTFWRFNIQVELTLRQTRVAYCINNGPAIGFWLPAKDQMMNVMFHSCNGFSMSVDSNEFSGPDPMWRDVLNNHQTRPFHCMLGGGDQIYNDAAMRDTVHFKEWLGTKNPLHKHSAVFTPEMQEELEQFYLDRYSMWFSQGLFGMANSQIPMVNIWDDHDIIDGFGSYPDHFMAAPVFAGLGAVAFKYYMLFQHQSLPDEDERTEPSWLLGASPGPYINQLSRSIFISLGRNIMFLGLDCRTERMRDEILSQETYDIVFDRCRREIFAGETKHLIVLLGVPIAYPRLNWLENVLTSKAMEPFKALGRAGMLGNFVNKFDGGVEILDDLDDHWTAKHHKQERNWFIQELQELAAEKSVRVTILGGDVHLGAIGQFYSNPKLSIPKDRDHRYMPNVISSAIVNTPPPEMMADVMNKRNKVHHLDQDTDEDMIPIFQCDVDGKQRNNHHLLPRRNWCSLREYIPGSTPRSSSPIGDSVPQGRPSQSLKRNDSFTRRDPQRGNLLRRLSSRKAPPSAYRSDETTNPYNSNDLDPRVDGPSESHNSPTGDTPARDYDSVRGASDMLGRQNSFRRRPTSLSRRASRRDKSGREGHIDLEGGIEVTLNCEVDQKDPAGVTTPYRLLVPALFYHGKDDPNSTDMRSKREKMADFIGVGRNQSTQRHGVNTADDQFENEDRTDQPHGAHHANNFLVGGQGDESDEKRPFSNGQASQTYQSTGSGQERPGSQGQTHTTASHQRASMDSERNQPSDSILSRLPRSQAPDESHVFFQRNSSRTRKNTSLGPPPPSNIDQLPASVQRRYQELNDGTPQSDYSDSPPSQRSCNQYSSPERGSSTPIRYSLNDRPMSSAPLASDQDRHYYTGPMEFPLLPANANQLRSGNKRTNYEPLLVEQSSSQSRQIDAQNERRVVSGPAAFPLPQHSSVPMVQSAGNQRQSLPNARSVPSSPPESGPRIRQRGSGIEEHNRNSTYLEYSAIGPVQRREGQSEFGGPLPQSTDLHTSQSQRPLNKIDRHYGQSDGEPGSSPREARVPGAYLEEDYDNDNDAGDSHPDDSERRLVQPRHGSGMPEKVARHFAGYEDDSRGTTAVSSGTKTRPGGGLGGLVRRLSSGGKDSFRGWKKR